MGSQLSVLGENISFNFDKIYSIIYETDELVSGTAHFYHDSRLEIKLEEIIIELVGELVMVLITLEQIIFMLHHFISIDKLFSQLQTEKEILFSNLVIIHDHLNFSCVTIFLKHGHVYFRNCLLKN